MTVFTITLNLEASVQGPSTEPHRMIPPKRYIMEVEANTPLGALKAAIHHLTENILPVPEEGDVKMMTEKDGTYHFVLNMPGMR